MDQGMLNIRYEALAGAQSELAGHYAAAHGAIEELKAKLAGGLEQWTGEAREAYDQVQREWDAAFGHMAQVLQKAQLIDGQRVDESCFVWDRTGRLVAQSTQLAGIRLG